MQLLMLKKKKARSKLVKRGGTVGYLNMGFKSYKNGGTHSVIQEKGLSIKIVHLCPPCFSSPLFCALIRKELKARFFLRGGIHDYLGSPLSPSSLSLYREKWGLAKQLVEGKCSKHHLWIAQLSYLIVCASWNASASCKTCISKTWR